VQTPSSGLIEKVLEVGNHQRLDTLGIMARKHHHI
jgi:hypothetical protein